MSVFEDRQRAYEAKFVHDEALQFKATVRRNKLLGLWAADALGKTLQDAEAYANRVVEACIDAHDKEAVYMMMRADLPKHVSDVMIQRQMDALMMQAQQDLRQ